MAITQQTMVDGHRNVVVKIHVTDDGGNDYSNAILLAANSLTPQPAKLRMVYFQSTSVGFSAVLDSDGAVNSHLLTITEGETVFDYGKSGGLVNDAATPTGDILITTAGAVAGVNMTIYMELVKDY